MKRMTSYKLVQHLHDDVQGDINSSLELVLKHACRGYLLLIFNIASNTNSITIYIALMMKNCFFWGGLFFQKNAQATHNVPTL